MFSFLKKDQGSSSSSAVLTPSFSEAEKIAMLENIYSDFLKKVNNIERERDEKIMAILRSIDERKIKDILKKVEQT